MPRSTLQPRTRRAPNAETLVRLIKGKAEASALTRRGICLLNAGDLEGAARAFATALDSGLGDDSLAALLASCYRAAGQPEQAAALLQESIRAKPSEGAARIRHALALWSDGSRDGAIRALRDAIRHDPERAELHFQLGTLLTAIDCFEEAELRFTQALNIDRSHIEAAINLAMCCGLRGAPSESVQHLRRAQAMHPSNPRIGLMLTEAMKAVRQQGLAVPAPARMFEEEDLQDRASIEELSHIIEHDPDFVDAFLAIPIGEVDETVFSMLLRTIEAALERQPEHAELHFHCGRLLERLGRRDAAIRENERAVEIEPAFTRALIELARLYANTDRRQDAASRLEQAIEAGAEYADVYYMLGNLYRDLGRRRQARDAFARALSINKRYGAARDALAALTA